MAYKIALTAGHYKYTAGKRCLKSLDPNETREWVLNDRIADKVEKLLQQYEGYELLRTDDTTGEKMVSLSERTGKANKWGADFYLSIHHNAGINGGSGGGIVVYAHDNAMAASLLWQKALYDALIAATGLRGNRSNPLGRANFHEVRETKMPAILLELGFMDSSTDVPIILSEAFADKCAGAIVDVIADRAKLTKKPESVKPAKPEAEEGTLYRVQTGAYSKKANAGAQAKKLKAAGFETHIVKVGGLYKVQTGAYSKKANAEAQAKKLKAAGFAAYITTRDSNADPDKKSNAEIAQEVIAGKWGNGAARRQQLASCGYDFEAIQQLVNEMLK